MGRQRLLRHEAPKPIYCWLQDFVRLAKWEDRGYYAMKATTERNQRQLHRLTRRGEEALSQPAAAVLAAASKAMGFADLTDASNKAALGAAKGAQAGKSASGSKRKQAHSAKLEEVWVVVLWVLQNLLVVTSECTAGASARSDGLLGRNCMPATVDTPLHCSNTGGSKGYSMRPAGFACVSHWLSHSVFVLAGAAREHTSMAEFLQHVPQGYSF